MLRDKSLIPLSHQHQHALALCVRIDRALKSGSPNVRVWQEEVARIFAEEIRYHFEAEERVLFPAARKYPPLQPLVERLLGEHGMLREFFAEAGKGSLDASGLRAFAETLERHVRTEERRLFEQCQQLMPGKELERLGAAMEDYFAHSGMPGGSCALPGE